MPRLRRIKAVGDVAYYHIISRTVGGEFLLGDTEKEKLLSIIKHYSSIYFVNVIGFCIMDNHFHLLVKTDSIENVYEDDLLERIFRYTKQKDREFSKDELEFFKIKLSDISEYIKSIKQTFSRWYNKLNDRKGYFWGDRFKSVLVESGESLLNMLAYIELNPVRAKLCKKPEEYRWCSLSYRLAKKWDNFLTFDGVEIENVRDYVSFIYQVGKVTKRGADGKELGKIDESADSTVNIWKHRVRYFSEGVVLGSKNFIEESFKRFGDKILKKGRKLHEVPLISTDLYSIKRVNNI